MTSKIFNKFKKEKGIYVKSSIVKRFIYKSSIVDSLDVKRSIVESFDVESFDVKRSIVESFDVESFDVESFDDGSAVGVSVEGKR